MKKSIILFFLFAVFSFLNAHEFWLQPEKFIYNYADIVNIRFLAGENFEGANWSGNNEKVNSLNFYYGGVKDNLADEISDEKGDSLIFRLCHEGTCMITYNGKNTFIELDSAKFNAYLLEDGLTDAIEYRKQHNETDSSGREFYQRSVKTIIQAGSKKDDTYKQQTSLPVDIIPLSNPYSVNDGASLRFRILFQSNPLASQLVKIWYRNADTVTKKEILTDSNGEISLSVNTKGKWMISTVKMIRLENNPQAQWQSYWGSCTWGYE